MYQPGYLSKREIKLPLRFILEQCEIEMMPINVHLILNAEIVVTARDIVKTHLCALNETWYLCIQSNEGFLTNEIHQAEN